MMELALASILSCADGAWIIEGLGQVRGMSRIEKFEVYREVRAAMPPGCDFSQFQPQKFGGPPAKL